MYRPGLDSQRQICNVIERLIEKTGGSERSGTHVWSKRKRMFVLLTPCRREEMTHFWAVESEM